MGGVEEREKEREEEKTERDFCKYLDLFTVNVLINSVTT